MECSKCGSKRWWIGDMEHGKAPRICMECGAHAGEVKSEFELAIGIAIELPRYHRNATKHWGIYSNKRRNGGNNRHITEYILDHKDEIIADMLAHPNPKDDQVIADKYEISLCTYRHKRKEWGLPARPRGNGNWAKQRCPISSPLIRFP